MLNFSVVYPSNFSVQAPHEPQQENQVIDTYQTCCELEGSCRNCVDTVSAEIFNRLYSYDNAYLQSVPKPDCPDAGPIYSMCDAADA